MRRALPALLVAAVALPGCGSPAADPGSYRAKAARACADVPAGDQALRGPGAIEQRVVRALAAAGTAARSVHHLEPPPELAEEHAEAVRVMLGQIARLRALRLQLEKRDKRPVEVLEGARAGLVAGDHATLRTLVALGIGPCH